MDEDELDPRIQVELEKLNTATDEINKLEIELDEANTTFRMLLTECTRRLKVHSSKYGSAIVSARPYYEALDVARVAQQECQRAAVSFQRANEVHEAAKETVSLAEARFISQSSWRFDSAWQETLNHATLKVRDAELQRAESAAQHGQATARYKLAQDKVHQLQQRLHRNVAKSRPYFEEKARCNDQLAAQKHVVEALQKHVAAVKAGYAASLRRLESISEEIHRKRAAAMEECRGVREPGVGAELAYEGELLHALDAHRASRSPNGDVKSRQHYTDLDDGDVKSRRHYTDLDDDDVWSEDLAEFKMCPPGGEKEKQAAMSCAALPRETCVEKESDVTIVACSSKSVDVSSLRDPTQNKNGEKNVVELQKDVDVNSVAYLSDNDAQNVEFDDSVPNDTSSDVESSQTGDKVEYSDVESFGLDRKSAELPLAADVEDQVLEVPASVEQSVVESVKSTDVDQRDKEVGRKEEEVSRELQKVALTSEHENINLTTNKHTESTVRVPLNAAEEESSSEQ